MLGAVYFLLSYRSCQLFRVTLDLLPRWTLSHRAGPGQEGDCVCWGGTGGGEGPVCLGASFRISLSHRAHGGSGPAGLPRYRLGY